MGRGDLVGAAILLSWVSVLTAVVVAERGGTARPEPTHRPTGTLTPRGGVTFPEDHSSFDVKRGKEIVGRVDADQGRLKAIATVPARAIWFVKRTLRLDVGKLDLPAIAGDLPRKLSVSSTLDATLAEDLTPVTFNLGTGGPGGALLAAAGRVDGTVVRLTITLGVHVEELTVPLTSPPLLEEAAMPLLAASGDLARPGTRYRIGTIDPQTGKPDTIVLEVVGPEVVAFGEGLVRSSIKVLRDADGPSPRAIWVDPSGRVLREELPLGLLAVRVAPPEAP